MLRKMSFSDVRESIAKGGGEIHLRHRDDIASLSLSNFFFLSSMNANKGEIQIIASMEIIILEKRSSILDKNLFTHHTLLN